MATTGEDEPAYRFAHGSARRPLDGRRVGRVSAGRDRDQLRGRSGPREADDESGRRRVAERVQPGDVPRRLDAEAVPRREGPHEQAWTREAEQEDGDAYERGPSPHLRQPQPEVERREQEEIGERVGGDDEKSDHAEREERSGMAGELLLRKDGPA